MRDKYSVSRNLVGKPSERKLSQILLYVVDQQTYIVTVAPGVDAALLLAICICLVSYHDR
jgi:uncharacterized protein YxjI